MRINLATNPRDRWVEFLKGWMVTTRLMREQELLKQAQGDKTIEDCKAKFNNAIHFTNPPYVPYPEEKK